MNGKMCVVMAIVAPLIGAAPLALCAQVTLTFQQGDPNGYAGTKDTHLWEAEPDYVAGEDTWAAVDGRGGGVGMRNDGLVRFDDIFGALPDRIPPGSSIISATLTLNVAGNDSSSWSSVHQMLKGWSEADTWNSWDGGGGVSADGTDAVAVADDNVGPPVSMGTHEIDVTSSVQAWSAGADNHGWVILHNDASDDAWRFDSSENPTLSVRPKLSVTIPEPATLLLMTGGGLAVVLRPKRRARPNPARGWPSPGQR